MKRSMKSRFSTVRAVENSVESVNNRMYNPLAPFFLCVLRRCTGEKEFLLFLSIF